MTTLQVNSIIIEPAHDKTYIKTCVTSENWDQPVHLCSLSESSLIPARR